MNGASLRLGDLGHEQLTGPVTATPSVAPTWRHVDAIEAATPAWAGGIPETAVLEIRGLGRSVTLVE
jgi:hypothetical protein